MRNRVDIATDTMLITRFLIQHCEGNLMVDFLKKAEIKVDIRARKVYIMLFQQLDL